MHQEERQGRGWSSRDVSREVVPSESFSSLDHRILLPLELQRTGGGFDIRHGETKIQVLKGHLHLGTESSWSHSLLLTFPMSWA